MLGAALAYYLAGRLASVLAIPPSFSSAVRTAAGIAPWGSLRFGRPAVAGVALGSFAINAQLAGLGAASPCRRG